MSGIATLIFGILILYFLVTMMSRGGKVMTDVEQQAIKAIEAQENSIYVGYIMAVFFLILGVFEIRECLKL